MELLTSSAVALARRIRSRQSSSREVVEAHIARIEAVNPALNAMVVDRFALALAEADAADAAVARGEALPPLHGVPCTIKESFALTGMPNTAGLCAREGIIAGEDATAVARLRAAGAIPLGVSNTSELCMWMESSNRVYGRTGNAFDPRRTPGGSSGGEGALVGAGASPLGLGADVGGSIRMPAFFNGVFGHKGTGGLVPNTGQHPNANGPIGGRFLSTGPLVRRAEDLMPVLRILAGPDGKDPACAPWTLSDPGRVDLSRLRVLVVPDDGRIAVCAELRQAQQQAAAALAARGAQVEEVRFDDFGRAFDIWSSMMADAQQVTFKELLFAGRPRARLPVELLKWLVGRSPHTLPALLLAVTEPITTVFPKRTARLVALGRALKRQVVQALGSDGLMLYPPHPTPAPRHIVPMIRPFNWTYTALLNVLELPVTAVPLGLDAKGMPLGVQVAASPGNDHLTIAAALALETDLGGWVLPKSTLS